MDAGKKVDEVVVDNSEGGAEETDALMDGLIADVSKDFEDAELAAMPDAPADETAEVDPEAAQDVEAPAEEGEPAEDDETDAEKDRSAERLVAREVELRLREDKLKANEERYSKLETENQQLRQQFEELDARIPHDFVEGVRTDPWAAFESQGIDPEHVVKVVLAQKLKREGKPVPEKLAEEIEKAEFKFTQRQLAKRQQDFEQKLAAQRFVEKTEADARQYIRAMSELKPEFSKHAPTVAKVAKANPDKVFAEIMDEISRDASARRREPGAQLISFAEAARRIENRWSEFRNLVGSPQEASTPGAQGDRTADDTQERAQQTGASAKLPGQPVKKGVKPLIPAPKAKTQEELEQEGLDAGLAEYKRLTLANRKQAGATK